MSRKRIFNYNIWVGFQSRLSTERQTSAFLFDLDRRMTRYSSFEASHAEAFERGFKDEETHIAMCSLFENWYQAIRRE